MDKDRLLQKYRWFKSKQRTILGTDVTFDQYQDLYRDHIIRGGTDKQFVLERLDRTLPATIENIRCRPFRKDHLRIKEYLKGVRKSGKKRGLTCSLSITDIETLLERANLTIWDIGFEKTGGKGFVLCRYEDRGNYDLDNVRFQTVQENTQEYFDHRTKWWSSRSK